MGFVNLHRHDHYSLFDGFGRAEQAANHAKSMGQIALGLTNHGNTSGLVEHYLACNDEEVGIKPILGVEAYFQPRFDKEKKRHHLTIFAKNLTGYHNMMRAVTEANTDKFFRYPIMDFETLERYHEGLIVLSGCMASAFARLAMEKKEKHAERLALMFKDIFGDDFFMEVQPVGPIEQRIINELAVEVGEKHNIRTVMTTDSHYVEKEDYDSYVVMHKIGGHDPAADYTERYMHSEKEVRRGWAKMMPNTNPSEYINNTELIASMCDVKLDFGEMVPKLEWDMPSKKKLKQIAVDGLKKKGVWNKEHAARIKHELGVIFGKKFEDYFLLCYDIVQSAVKKGIAVGKGRGSVCGCDVAYALGLTDVDPIALGTNFERFLRPNKNSMPDIDMDFESARRGEVIDYILKKYQGRAAPITAFGYYKVKNLANDLAKFFELDAKEKADFKTRLEMRVDDDHSSAPYSDLLRDPVLKQLDKKHDHIVKHFSKLYNQVRFIGRHAAGVAITADDISKYVSLMRVRGNLQTCFDLESLGKINVIKMDILGLSTMSVVGDVERVTDARFTYDLLEDQDVYDALSEALTVGVFQFEKGGARDVLSAVRPRNIQELIACNALNRPAPKQLGLLDQFVDGKAGSVNKKTPWYPYTKDTYGTLIYQEHVMDICRNLAQMEWADVDKVMKSLRQTTEDGKDPLRDKFVEGAFKHGGLTRSQASDLYDKMTLYLFNKGHGAGYSILSFYTTYLRLNYPLEFFWALMKNETEDRKRESYKSEAVRNGILLFMPHVNGSAEYEIIDYEGERVIREGISSIKGVGFKTAKEIVKLGPFKNKAHFIASCPKRTVNAKTFKALEEAGALEFDENRILKRVERYNSSLYSKSVSFW